MTDDAPKPYDKLRKAEEEFLLAAGWIKINDDAWEEPVESEEHDEFRILPFGHAVNSEKLHGLERGTSTAESLGALAHAEREYLLASGWKYEERDLAYGFDLGHDQHPWVAPDSRNRRRASLKQAVNSQKQYDRGSA